MCIIRRYVYYTQKDVHYTQICGLYVERCGLYLERCVIYTWKDMWIIPGKMCGLYLERCELIFKKVPEFKKLKHYIKTNSNSYEEIRKLKLITAKLLDVKSI